VSEEPFDILRGSGNVWADFGYEDADLRQAKGTVAARIIAILDARGLSTRAAARESGFAAADFSRIRNADYARFTLDRLIRILHAFDHNVEVRVHIGKREKAA